MILPPWMVRVRHGILRLELLRSLKKLYRNLAIAGVVPMNKVRPRMDAVAHSGTILRAKRSNAHGYQRHPTHTNHASHASHARHHVRGHLKNLLRLVTSCRHLHTSHLLRVLLLLLLLLLHAHLLLLKMHLCLRHRPTRLRVQRGD